MLRVSDSTTEMLLADDAISFVSISTGRMCFVLVTQTVRLAIACLLLVSGAEWLAYTTSMSDMLLNAVALEFVLNIDELVFEALGPLQLKNVIDLCSSLPGPPVTRWRGIDRTACMTFVIFAGSASLIVFFWLLPYRDVLIETKSALCGGERDFVFAVGATGVPIWSLYRAPNRTAQNGSGAGYWRNGSWVEPTLKPEEDKWSETPLVCGQSAHGNTSDLVQCQGASLSHACRLCSCASLCHALMALALICVLTCVLQCHCSRRFAKALCPLSCVSYSVYCVLFRLLCLIPSVLFRLLLPFPPFSCCPLNVRTQLRRTRTAHATLAR